MAQFIHEFCESQERDGYQVATWSKEDVHRFTFMRDDYRFEILLAEDPAPLNLGAELGDQLDTLLITGASTCERDYDSRVTHFSLSDMAYIKRRTQAEVLFMRHMVPLKARFVPSQRG